MSDLIYALFARAWRTQLGVPPDALLDPVGVAAVLEPYVAMPAPDDAEWARLRALAGAAQVERDGWRNLRCEVGRGADRARLRIERYEGNEWSAYCDSSPTDSVGPHLRALLIAVAYADPGLRPRLLQPPWRHFLAPMLVPGREAPPAAEARPGWLRAVLHTERSGERHAVLGGRLTVWLMHRSKNGRTVLKPRRPPATLDELDRVASGLTAGERALMRRIDDLRTLAAARPGYGTYRDADVGLSQARDRCGADIIELLGEIREVRLDDRPITVDDTPWRPRLVATDGPDGGLAMAWAERAQLTLMFRRPFVVVDDRLRPVDPSIGRATLQQAQRDPPPVPAAHVGAFIDLVVATPVAQRPPIELYTTALPVEARDPVPRLMLSAAGDTLRAGLRFGYGTTECGPDDPELVHDAFAETPCLVRRDLAAEQVFWRRLAEAVDDLPDRPEALEFAGEAAFDFLHFGRVALADFELVTDETLDLRRWRPTGTLNAQGGLGTGLDWFDLDVHFDCGGQRVSTTAVLESWRAGRRYLRLGDGTLARLPDTWLARHGEALGELRELRSKRRRVGLFAAPVVAELLDDIELDGAAREAAERMGALARRMGDFDGIPEREVPSGLQATLRDYQHRGYRWMRALADLGFSGVLADDMGLGKTLQTLTVLLDAHAMRPGPSLVVAPTSVIHNWVLEARRFTPGLRVALFYGKKRGAPPIDVDVVITSYALMRLDREALSAIEWHYVILDEAQHIKNPASKTARAARSLKAEHRLALSGTPLENHMLELWSLFEFVMPGFFGGRDAFRRRYVDAIQKSDDAIRRDDAFARLRQRIRPFVLRRLKREVAAELPARQEQTLWCDLSDPERRLYDAVKTTYRETVFDRVDDVGVGRASIVILEALTRLRQASCDAGLLPFPEARAVKRSAKRDRLLETLETLVEESHRALVFSQWPTLLKRVAADLRGAGLPYLYLDGSTRERADLQARWNAPDGPPVFLISLKAGGTGLNLVGADVVIHLDPWWNPQTEQQATDRAHRIGQTRPVMVYKMVARDTVEEKVIELQARKRALFEATVDGDRATVDGLSRADLEAVFGIDGPASGEATSGQ